jgi:hypothetical protein
MEYFCGAWRLDTALLAELCMLSPGIDNSNIYSVRRQRTRRSPVQSGVLDAQQAAR